MSLGVGHLKLKYCAVGFWFMHHHLEIHAPWGLNMAILVEKGMGPKSLLPPPSEISQLVKLIRAQAAYKTNIDSLGQKGECPKSKESRKGEGIINELITSFIFGSF